MRRAPLDRGPRPRHSPGARPAGTFPAPGLQRGEGTLATFEIGVVLPLMQFGPERTTPRWADLRGMALRAESIGFDTLWIPDELVWFSEGTEPQGVWDGISMAGAAAAV